MSHDAHQSHTPDAKSGYERRDVNILWTSILTVAVVAGIILSVVFVDELFIHTSETMKTDLQLAPPNTMLRDLRAREDEALTTYKLLDPKAGIYRIPIDQAMQLYANKMFSTQRSAAVPQ